jgi:hypothetical protein
MFELFSHENNKKYTYITSKDFYNYTNEIIISASSEDFYNGILYSELEEGIYDIKLKLLVNEEEIYTQQIILDHFLTFDNNEDIQLIKEYEDYYMVYQLENDYNDVFDDQFHMHVRRINK